MRPVKTNIEHRKVHRQTRGSHQTGSLADLSDVLSKEGFVYQYKAGQRSYFDTGVARYRHPSGMRATLKRVQKGVPAMWTGASVGLTRTAAQPDVWQLIKRRK